VHELERLERGGGWGERSGRELGAAPSLFEASRMRTSATPCLVLDPTEYVLASKPKIRRWSGML